MTTYNIEVWDNNTKKYFVFQKNLSFERVNILMNKPYMKKLTRRVVEIKITILRTVKANK